MESSVLTQVVMPLCLFIIMFGMGLSLTTKDFSRVFVYPKAILIGLFGQLLLLPLIGFGIAISFFDNALLAMGLMLLAACPGGTTSNLVTHLAKGDTALSVSLTAFSSIMTLFSIPLIMGIAANVFTSSTESFSIPVERTLLTLFVITLLPISIGMMVRHRFPGFAAATEPKINVFSAVFLVLLVVAVCMQQKDKLPDFIAETGAATATLNLSTMLLGFVLAMLFRLNANQSTSITIEVGIQNSALAMMVATTLLNSPEMAIPAAVYSLVMYASGLVIIGFRYRQRSRSEN